MGLGDYTKVTACIRKTEGDLATAATERYLPLTVDTRNFDAEFKWSLLEAVTATCPLDDELDGVAIQSDNWQMLNTLQGKFRDRVKCIYIDPPYNTGSDGFSYKDAYQHSSWMAMMDNRLEAAQGLMATDAALFVSLDDREHSSFRQIANQRLGQGNFVANVIWQKNYSPKNSARHFSEDHFFPGCDTFEAIESIFALQFGRN